VITVPLREGLVATNVPSLACLAALPALRVAAPGRTSTLTGHRV
jgi:hypothetical protein